MEKRSPLPDYRVVRSGRSTVSAEVCSDGTLTVRVPRYMSDAEIADFVAKNTDKIERGRAKVRQMLESCDGVKKLSDDELAELKKEALRVIPERVAHFARLIDVSYTKITVRPMKSRWGSCSNEGALSFNLLLMLAPPKVRDSVIVHELCHRREMNHSQKFYALVGTYCPDYDDCRAWLKQNGPSLIIRL